MRLLKMSCSFAPLGLALGLLIIFQPISAGQNTAEDPGYQSPSETREQLLFTYALPATAYLTEAEIMSLSLPSVQRQKDKNTLSPSQPTFEPWAVYKSKNSSPLAAMEKSLFTGTIIGFVGLNIVDYITTKQAIKKFGAEEVSPIIQPFAKNDFALAAFKVGTTLMSVIALRDIYRADKPMAWALSLIGNFLVSYAVVTSLEQLEGARNGPSPQR